MQKSSPFPSEKSMRFERILVVVSYILIALVAVWTAVLFVCGCSALSHKGVAVANQVYGFRLETSGSASSTTVLPNFFIGSGQSAICTAPVIDRGQTTQIVISYVESGSFLGELFGISAKTRTFSYVGMPGEDAAQTSARLDAVARILTADTPANAPAADSAPTANTSVGGTPTPAANAPDGAAPTPAANTASAAK